MMLAVTPLAEIITAAGAAIPVVLGGVVPLVKVWRRADDLETRVTSLEAEIEKLRVREADLLAQLAAANAQIEVRDLKIAELEAELSEVRARLAKLEG